MRASAWIKLSRSVHIAATAIGILVCATSAHGASGQRPGWEGDGGVCTDRGLAGGAQECHCSPPGSEECNKMNWLHCGGKMECSYPPFGTGECRCRRVEKTNTHPRTT